MRKYLVILAATAVSMLISAALGLAVMAIGSGIDSRSAAEQDSWALNSRTARAEAEYQRATEEFRTHFQWLSEEDSDADAEADARAKLAAAEKAAPPPPPVWHFVGVLLEDASSVALVSESGRVRRYKVGDTFADGTRLLALTEQSIRVSQNGLERDLFLYRNN